MFTYTNVSDSPLEIPNVGVVAPGETIDSDDELTNSSLETVTAKKADAKSVSPANDPQKEPLQSA